MWHGISCHLALPRFLCSSLATCLLSHTDTGSSCLGTDGSVVKNPPARAGDARDLSYIIGSERFLGVANSNCQLSEPESALSALFLKAPSRSHGSKWLEISNNGQSRYLTRGLFYQMTQQVLSLCRAEIVPPRIQDLCPVHQTCQLFLIHKRVLRCSVLSNSLWPCGLCSPPGSSVHGISQAKILEWAAVHPAPGDVPNPGIKPTSPALADGFFPTEPPGKPSYT